MIGEKGADLVKQALRGVPEQSAFPREAALA
jgi:hypothetical protein